MLNLLTPDYGRTCGRSSDHVSDLIWRSLECVSLFIEIGMRIKWLIYGGCMFVRCNNNELYCFPVWIVLYIQFSPHTGRAHDAGRTAR